MNEIRTIDTTYITGSKTIELIEVIDESTSPIRTNYLYMYNYEGYHFRLFLDIINLSNFLCNLESICIEFDEEDELDEYLLNMEVI